MLWYNGITVAKDPDAVIDWRWDWSSWLDDSVSISSVDTEVTGSDSALAVDSATVSGEGVDVTVSGGTAGESYSVRVRITTSTSLTDDRTVVFEVGEQ